MTKGADIEAEADRTPLLDEGQDAEVGKAEQLVVSTPPAEATRTFS